MFTQDMKPENLLDQLIIAQKNDDVDTELEILRQMLSLAQQEGNTVEEIILLRGLGNVFQKKGQLQKAHSYRVIAAKLAADPASGCPQEVQMSVEGDLGRSYIETRGWTNAEIHTQRALEMAQSLHHQRGQSVFNINLGWIYSETGRLEQAYQLAAEVLKTAEILHDDYILGLQHLNLAEYLFSEKRLSESQRHARKALAHAEEIGDTYIRMRALRVLGAALQRARLVTGRSEYSADAERYLQQTVELAQKFSDASLEAGAELGWAELCDNRRQDAETAKHYQRALELLESVRDRLGYEEFQQTYFQTFQRTYGEVTEFLLRQNQPDEAFLTAERLRSRLLLALLGQGRSNTHSWLANQQKELAEILNVYGREVLHQYQPSRIQEVTVRWETEGDDGMTADAPLLREARQRFLHQYEGPRLYHANWQPQPSPPPIHFEEARRFLGQDDALVDYLITERSVIIFVATTETCHFQHLTYPFEKIARDVEELHITMQKVQTIVLNPFFYNVCWLPRKQQSPWPDALKEPMAKLHQILEKLYALLVVPVLPVIDKKRHWVIVPFGPLHQVPWAALRSPGQYLIERHTVSLLPSASTGAVLKNSRRAANKAVFFADSDLPKAQDEVQESYKVYQEGPLPFIGNAATKQVFLEHAPTAKLLHFACHHYFDAEIPLLSFLKLAGNSGADFLYAFEVTDLNLCSELVSLSTCQSGFSRIEAGDEQYGLIRTFLAAGAQSVISTLWNTESRSAADFFPSFYTHAYEQGLAQALALAQRRLLANPRYELPNFWAPYILSGQWNKSLTFGK